MSAVEKVSFFEHTQDVQVLNTIKQRRSVGHVSQQQPSREAIERMLEAATFAPSHHVTEPWRFFVLTGSARQALGDVMANSFKTRLEQSPSDPLPNTEALNAQTSNTNIQKKLMRERAKPMRAPVIIVVALTDVPQLQGDYPIECVEAAGAAVQNMMLAAEELGLATVWRTGDPAYDPMVKRWFGLKKDDLIVAFLYTGYPMTSRPMRIPTHFSVKTTWLS
jgi:nitroreductase